MNIMNMNDSSAGWLSMSALYGFRGRMHSSDSANALRADALGSVCMCLIDPFSPSQSTAANLNTSFKGQLTQNAFCIHKNTMNRCSGGSQSERRGGGVKVRVGHN